MAVGVLILGLCLMLVETALAQGVSQADLDYLAAHLSVRYAVEDNLEDTLKTFRARVTLTNTGGRALPAREWVLYFCQPNLLQPRQYPYPQGYVLPGQNITVRHLQGTLFSLEPSAGYRPLAGGESRALRLVSENYSVARTDVLPNWYVAAAGLEPRKVVSTAGESLDWVAVFASPHQWKRYDYRVPGAEAHDRYDPYTPAARFSVNQVADLHGPGQHVLPTPRDVTLDGTRTVTLDTRDWVVHAPDAFAREARLLTDRLGIKRVTRAPSSHVIVFSMVDIRATTDGKQLTSPEAYSLDVNPDTYVIEIKSRDPRGAFYGVMTLLHLADEENQFQVPAVRIVDGPRFGYRGVMLDVARNFHPPGDVRRLLDLMARYKLNVLHLHLTDDEGWRLQIPGMPELTQVGGRRCHDLREESCLLPFLGSGPSASPRGSGFYTVQDYTDILRHAADRHIQVIPEVDMPGHGHAAIKAMEARRRRLLAAGNPTEANRLSLVEAGDPSVYRSVQQYTDNAVNPCLPAPYAFLIAVVAALVEMHREVMPLTQFHFGGDEVAKGAWVNSSACRPLLDSGLREGGFKDLKEYFVTKVSNITSQFGLDLNAWEDGVMESSSTPYARDRLPNRHVTAYAWDNIWEWGASNRAHKLANAGYKVVMAQATHLYFDHPYEPDPEERGQYWAARATSTRKVFGFRPLNLYANADVTRAGDPVRHEDLCGEDGKDCVPLDRPENIVGMQGHLWSEEIRTRPQADSMLFPRLLALAERAWHEAPWEGRGDNASDLRGEGRDWARFANTLGYRELGRLDRLGVHYRVPLPGARVSNGRLQTNVAYPGLVVEYSEDGGATWCQASDVTAPASGSVILLRTRSADGGRYSRVVRMTVSGNNSAPPSCGIIPLVFLLAALSTQIIRR